jgi:hypothetical protein
MTLLKGLMQKLFSKERRKADRMPADELSAYYWTGAAPREHIVRDISSTGLYLLTEERWYPGTMVKMTLQKRNEEANYPDRAISLQSKAVRWGEDGVGLEFVLPDGRNRTRNENLLEADVDRKRLQRFLKDLQTNDLVAFVEEIGLPIHGKLDPGAAAI